MQSFRVFYKNSGDNSMLGCIMPRIFSTFFILFPALSLAAPVLSNTLSRPITNTNALSTPAPSTVAVDIIGVNAEQKQNIESQLSLLQKSKNNNLSKTQIESFHNRAEKEILQALQPYGYYHTKVQSSLKINGPNHYQMQYIINLGQPIRISSLQTKVIGPGADNACLATIFDCMTLKPNAILNHALYEKDKTQALSCAIQAGYLHAYYSEHEVIVDLSKHKADIKLIMHSGPLFTFGRVSFKQDYFTDQFLNRFVPYCIGSVYKPEQVAELENTLAQSGYFKEVTVVPQIPTDFNPDNINNINNINYINTINTVVPVEVNLTRNRANQYLFGIGYDTNTLARLRLGWDKPYLNKWGHRLTTNAKLSQIDKNVESDYIIPGRHPLNDEFRLAMIYRDDEYQDKPSTLYSFAVSETHKVKDWHRTITLRYVAENFKDSDLVNEYSRLVLPSISLVKTKNDYQFNRSLPTDGYRLALSLRGGINPFLKDKSFAQANFEGKWLKTLSAKDTLIARAELGATTPEDLKDLPLSIRFFAGGDQSIRGYGYRSLPNEVDKNGELRPVGGAYLAVGSLEYNRLIKAPFSFATFVDGGNAFNSLNDLGSEFQVGVGVGVLFSTPVGPIKIYLAKPVTSHENSWRIHLNFGPEI